LRSATAVTVPVLRSTSAAAAGPAWLPQFRPH